MFLLRLLVALCAAPLVMVSFAGVAYLAIRVHPLYILLALVCVALVLVAGWHMHEHFEDKGSGAQAFASGIVLVATAAAGYVVTLNWAAPRHMCTVVEARTWYRHTPGGGETHNYRRLACDDGRTDRLGNEVAARKGADTTDRHKGDRLLVAYDPNGRLPSLAIKDRVWWVAGAGTGMLLVMAIHIGVVIADRRRRNERGEDERRLTP
ncbi:hypothetical protein [Actinomadura rudentiformis]|uniref:Cytochrome d ubiquinol oxidase subunit II n=1 Tax=Actinomadura rudentiformis TaxID=359158 RepID=A0A6H9YIM7_9ACTN|nr:hypothetical protein [Actinomadura rudentiformis]KAB2345189.1 cytochrome d ubiquinol oxidase subunit II [Actinomadura rudentiformis]